MDVGGEEGEARFHEGKSKQEERVHRYHHSTVGSGGDSTGRPEVCAVSPHPSFLLDPKVPS